MKKTNSATDLLVVQEDNEAVVTIIDDSEKCGASVEPEIQEPKEGVSHKKWILGGIIGGVAFVSVVTVGVLFAMGILGGKEEIVQTSAGVMQTDTEISNAAIQMTEQPTEVPTATPTITQNHVTDSANAMSEIKETAKVIEVNLTEEEYAFGVDKNKKDRKKYVTFSDEYYSASQRLVVGGDNTEFDLCGDKASVEKFLKKKDKNVTIGVQNGTTGQFYCEGNKDWGFDGLDVTTTGYKNGFLAVKDMLNHYGYRKQNAAMIK